jgi:hypothetical protein
LKWLYAYMRRYQPVFVRSKEVAVEISQAYAKERYARPLTPCEQQSDKVFQDLPHFPGV